MPELSSTWWPRDRTWQDSTNSWRQRSSGPQTQSLLHESIYRGEIEGNVARDRLARVGKMPIRLLGDAVLRRRAWELADRLGWASTYDAEYIALAQLQADAFVTLDAALARSVVGIVPTVSVDELL